MYSRQQRAGSYIRCTAAAIGLLFFAPQFSFAQFVGNPLIPKPGEVIVYSNDAKGGHHQVATIADRDKISTARRQPGMLCTVMDDGTGKAKTYQLISTDVEAELIKNTNWVEFASGGGGGTVGAFNGDRPITGLPTVGLNPGTNDLAKWIEAVFYPSLGPTASLTANPSGVKEMGPAGSTPVTLTWTAGRAAETEAITAITVNGQNVFTTSPAAGSSVNGTLSATATNNQANSYSMTVKTADNKTQTASASVSFQWKRYYGFLSLGDDGSGQMPTNAQILTLQNEFGTAAAVSNKSVSPTGSQKLVIAYPSTWGGTKITVGVNDSTGAFDKTSMSFTNASGGVTTYTIFVQKDNTAGALTFTVQ